MSLKEDKSVSLCVAPLQYIPSHTEAQINPLKKKQSTQCDNNSPSLHLLMAMKMLEASNMAPGCRPKELGSHNQSRHFFFSAGRDSDVIGKQMIRQSRFAAGEKSGRLAGLRRALPGSRVTAHDRNPNIMAGFPPRTNLIFMKHRLRSLADGQAQATVVMI